MSQRIVFGSPEARNIRLADLKLIDAAKVTDPPDDIKELLAEIEDVEGEIAFLEEELEMLRNRLDELNGRLEQHEIDDGPTPVERELTIYDLRRWNAWARGEAPHA